MPWSACHRTTCLDVQHGDEKRLDCWHRMRGKRMEADTAAKHEGRTLDWGWEMASMAWMPVLSSCFVACSKTWKECCRLTGSTDGTKLGGWQLESFWCLGAIWCCWKLLEFNKEALGVQVTCVADPARTALQAALQQCVLHTP